MFDGKAPDSVKAAAAEYAKSFSRHRKAQGQSALWQTEIAEARKELDQAARKFEKEIDAWNVESKIEDAPQPASS